MPSAHPDRTGPPGAGGPPDVDSWVFDVDGCLVDSLTGTSLRPGARALLGHLGRVAASFCGAPAGRLRRGPGGQFGVDGHVSDYFPKEGRDAAGCYLTGHLPVDPRRAVFVDDRPEDLASGLEVLPVSPYLSEDPHDHALARGGAAGRPALVGDR